VVGAVGVGVTQVGVAAVKAVNVNVEETAISTLLAASIVLMDRPLLVNRKPLRRIATMRRISGVNVHAVGKMCDALAVMAQEGLLPIRDAGRALLVTTGITNQATAAMQKHANVLEGVL